MNQIAMHNIKSVTISEPEVKKFSLGEYKIQSIVVVDEKGSSTEIALFFSQEVIKNV